jgi:hypothetical protein
MLTDWVYAVKVFGVCRSLVVEGDEIEDAPSPEAGGSRR